jgi:hypothetical protein
VPIARVHVAGDSPEAEVTRRSVQAETSGNVALAEDAPGAREGFDAYDDAFLQVVLPAGAGWGDGTVDLVLDLFAHHDVGVVRAVDDDGSITDVVRTRALRRAVHDCPDDDPVEAAARLFGVWWVDVTALDIASRVAPTPDEVEPDEAPWWRRRQRLDLWFFDGLEALLRRAAR